MKTELKISSMQRMSSRAGHMKSQKLVLKISKIIELLATLISEHKDTHQLRKNHRSKYA